MASSGAKFVIDFVGEMKEFNKALKEVQTANAKLSKTDQLKTKEQHAVVRKMFSEERKERSKLEREKVTHRKNELKETHKLERQKSAIINKERVKLSRERDQAVKKQVDQQRQQDKVFKERGGFMAGLTGRKSIIPPWRDPETNRRVSAHGIGGAARAVGGVAAGGLALVGGFVASALLAGYEKFKQREMAVSGLAGISPSGRQTRKDLTSARGTAAKFGYSSMDVANMTPAMGRSTGQGNVTDLIHGMRATGMEAGEVGGSFGALRQAGVDFKPGTGGSAGAKMFSKLMSGATASGLEHAEIPKYLEGISGNITALSQTVSEVNVDSVNKLTAMLGKTGPGQKGASGAALVGSINQGFTNPGGGEWGGAFMRQAMGFGKPGGTTGYWQAERMRQQGINDPQNVGRVVDEARKQFPNANERAGVMGQTFNIPMEKWDAFEKAVTGGDKDKITKAIDDAKPLQDKAATASIGLLAEAKHQAKLFEKGVVAGEKVASTIEDVEDTLSDLLEQILGVLADIFNVVKGVGKTFGVGTSDPSSKIDADIQKGITFNSTNNLKAIIKAKQKEFAQASEAIEGDKPLAMSVFGEGGENPYDAGTINYKNRKNVNQSKKDAFKAASDLILKRRDYYKINSHDSIPEESDLFKNPNTEHIEALEAAYKKMVGSKGVTQAEARETARSVQSGAYSIPTNPNVTVNNINNLKVMTSDGHVTTQSLPVTDGSSPAQRGSAK